EEIFKDLSDREKRILNWRYGLDGQERKTLEEIGKEFKITRERVRQIENLALKKVKHNASQNSQLRPIEFVVVKTLEDHGGAMTEEHLLEKILVSPNENPKVVAATKFFLRQLLKHRIEEQPEGEHWKEAWKIPSASLEFVGKTLIWLHEFLQNHTQPLMWEKLWSLLQQEQYFKDRQDQLDEKSVHAYLRLSKRLGTNPFNEWGLIEWKTITLKRMTDRIYLVLKKENKPLHFVEIAKKINELGLDKKSANPATIHNELILDKKYVLVGRGIYALTEWGYKPGVVADVIAQVIKDAGKPLTKAEIISRVLKHRLVKESTIALALMNKNRFVKLPNGEYNVKE
ncbi:MAG: HTH domain-containing protein, partial [Candidatus Komeilibacteria bacterium]|nr:HTH domain-containing protein [Candidatus Komeilibacteria bacterium]